MTIAIFVGNNLQAHHRETTNELYQLALVQSFEFTFELGWKTVKDYLCFQGVKNVSLPREAIKQGFHHHIIEEGQTWINMLEDRNLAHTYDEEKAKRAMRNITGEYVKAVEQVYDCFREKAAAHTLSF